MAKTTTSACKFLLFVLTVVIASEILHFLEYFQCIFNLMTFKNYQGKRGKNNLHMLITELEIFKYWTVLFSYNAVIVDIEDKSLS